MERLASRARIRIGLTHGDTVRLVVGAARRALSSLAAAALIVAALMILVPTVLGLEPQALTDDSMREAMGRGSLVFTDRVPASELRVGDVIAVAPPTGSSDAAVTRRVVALAERRGDLLARTSGDSNPRPDPDPLVLGAAQPRVVLSIPYLGFVVSVPAIGWACALIVGLGAIALLARMRGEARPPGREAAVSSTGRR